MITLPAVTKLRFSNAVSGSCFPVSECQAFFLIMAITGHEASLKTIQHTVQDVEGKALPAEPAYLDRQQAHQMPAQLPLPLHQLL